MSAFVCMVDYFKHVNMIQFEYIKLPTQKVIDYSLDLHIHIKIYKKSVNEALVDTESRFDICSLNFLNNFKGKLLSKLKRLVIRI